MALARIVSKTGSTAVGDALIAPRTSPVARSRSRASDQLTVARRKLREQAHVLEGDHRLVRERGHQLDLSLAEGPDLAAPGHDDADRGPVLEHRHEERGASAQELDRLDTDGVALGVRAVGHQVHDLDGLSLGDRAGRSVVRPILVRQSPRLDERARQAPVGDQPERLAVEEQQVPNRRGAEAKRAVEDRVEHGIDGRGRARDDPEDRARRPLALQRLGDLVEQPRVPDGDGGLVGEALEGGDLSQP